MRTHLWGKWQEPSEADAACSRCIHTEARARRMAIPSEIAVMGFGDVPFVADMVPSLTTVRINGERIGLLAAQFLIDRAENRPVADATVNVGYSIIERESA